MSRLRLYGRVMETVSSHTGTGTYTLAGAVTGHRTFAAVGNGNSCRYCAFSVDGSGNPNGGWEVGRGTYTVSGTTLSRDEIYESSNSNNKVSWSSANLRVFLDAPAFLLDRPTDFNVLDYHGSGCGTATTGDISSASSSLVVASAATFRVGQGILIKGAGAASAHLVTTITAISGTTFTLADAASSTVDDAVVQHDDTDAINAAIADAVAAGGGTVFLPKLATGDGKGWYRCNGALNVDTNSIITFPVEDGESVHPVWINLLGENRGQFNEAWSAATSGVVIDATDAPDGTGDYPAVISGMEYAVTAHNSLDTSLWNNLGISIDHVSVFVAPDSTLSGINLHNTYLGRIGDHVDVLALSDGSDWVEPTNTTAGILFPGPQNNIFQECGACRVAGFDTGIIAGEHVRFRRPGVAYCHVGLEIANGYHLVSGTINVEKCTQVVKFTAEDVAVVDLLFEVEQAVSEWYGYSGDQVEDVDAVARGRIAYANLRQTVGYAALTATSGIAIDITNLVTTDGSEVVIDDYIAKWDFADATDETGDYDLTNHNTATFATGKLGNGVQLNGSSQYLTNAGISGLGSSDFTICGWFKPDTDVTAVLASKHGYLSNGGFQVYRLSTGEIGALVLGGSSTTPASTAAGESDVDVWMFVSVVVDSVAKTLSLRVNNGAEETGDWTGTTGASTMPFSFGVNYEQSGEAPQAFFEGMLDAWRLYDRQLSTDELTALYNSGNGLE